MKLSNLKTITFSELTAGALDNSIRLWIENNGREATFINLLYSFDGTTFTAVLLYSE